MEDKTFAEIVERLAKIEVKIDDLKTVKEKVDKHDVALTEIKTINDNQQKEIDAIKENNKWISRAVVGAVITAIVGVIFCFIKLGLKI